MAVNPLLLNRANAAVMSRDYALAARLFGTLIKANPEDKDLLVRLGNVYIKSGEDEKALPVFEKLLETDSQNTEFLMTLGGIYRRLKRYDDSIEVLNKALKAGAKEETAYYNLGFTYKFMGKYEEAIDCFEVVVTLNPSDVLAFNHLGTIYEMKGDHEGAIAAYQKGLKIDANHPILHLNLAKSFESSKKIDAALREYEAALRYKPGWAEAYYNYTKLLLQLGRVKEAEALAEQGISINEHDADLQSVLGDIFMAQSDYEAAEKKYNDSIQLNSNHPTVLQALARSLEAQGKNSEAVEMIQKARVMLPDDEKLLKASASINLSAQKIVAASKDIKELFDKSKDDLETLDLAGQYYICTDDEERAKKVYRKIEANDPHYKSHLTNASNRYKQKGELEKAESYINKYLEANPNDAKAIVSLALIEEKLGKHSQALSSYNRALASDANNRLAQNSAKRLAENFGVQDTPPLQHEQEIPADPFEEEAPYEINLGEEERVVQEEPEKEEAVLNDDDFDFESFGKSPLLEDENEVDFKNLAENQEQAEIFDDNSANLNLVEDSPLVDDEGMVMPEPPAEMPSFNEPEAPQMPEAPAPKMQMPAFDTSAIEQKMNQMQENMQRALDAATNAQLAANNAQLAMQEEAARRAAEETAKKLAEQQAAIEEATRKLQEQQAAAEEAARKLAEEEAARKAEEEEAARKLAEEEAAHKAEEEEAHKAEEEEAARKAAEAELVIEEPVVEEAAEQQEGDGFDEIFDGIMGASAGLEEEVIEEPEIEQTIVMPETEEPEIEEPAIEEEIAEEPEIAEIEEDAIEEETEIAEIEEPEIEEPVFEAEDAPAIEEESLEEEPLFDEEPVEELLLDQEPPLEEETSYEPQSEEEPQPVEGAQKDTTAFDAALDKATALVPAIENILKDENGDHDFSAEIRLFKTLRALSESLPEESRHTFMQSRARLSLDYIISVLEGNPGLLKTSKALRKSGVLDDAVPEDAVETDLPINKLKEIVIGDMKALSNDLEEEDLRIALNNLADAALE